MPADGQQTSSSSAEQAERIPPPSPRRVFISYSRKDKELLDELLKHLSNMVSNGWLEPWSDRLIAAGEPWKATLQNRILTADVILLLVSPDFNASEFIQTQELTMALERCDHGELRIVPILLRPVDLKQSRLAELQLLPKTGEAITLWNNQDSAWLEVVRGLYAILEPPLPHEKPLHASGLAFPMPPPQPSTPEWGSEQRRALGAELKSAREELAEARKEGRPESERQRLLEGIAQKKRALREGSQLQPGSWIDQRFELLCLLGRGSFGAVWLARDELSGRKVALKILKDEVWQSPTSRQRFESGIRAMLSLSHPHVLRVIEPWQEERQDDHRSPKCYVVLELAENGDLQRFIESIKPGAGEVLRVVLEIASALEHAHNHPEPCIHRDVKPSNILLMADGTARLTDFDLARIGDSTHGTSFGLGTFFYAAPELIQQRRSAGAEDAAKADPRMDIYSLAVTLLTGNAVGTRSPPGASGAGRSHSRAASASADPGLCRRAIRSLLEHEALS